jgi:hypothetical protein
MKVAELRNSPMTDHFPVDATGSLGPPLAATSPTFEDKRKLTESSTEAPGAALKRYPFNFSTLREGDKDPTLNKVVTWLIDCDDNYIVYLDEEDYVEWTMNDNSLLGPDTGQYLNMVGCWRRLTPANWRRSKSNRIGA